MRIMLLGVAGVLALTGPAWAGPYNVFCADGRIEVEYRTLEQEITARGSNVCQFGSFDYASDAENFALKNFGGKGSPCNCH
jgi:hypothetical protein